ncbi:hypothetical protein [Desulfosarcina variabilis]|uniref:hypothetical protein n=1 Tax=Desulfosarcina variabilis TaxID=2300 RepID=UPI003AFA41A1
MQNGKDDRGQQLLFRAIGNPEFFNCRTVPFAFAGYGGNLLGIKMAGDFFPAVAFGVHVGNHVYQAWSLILIYTAVIGGVVRLRHDLWGRCGGWFRLIHLGRDARRFNTLRQERGIAPLAAHHADERLEGIGNPFFYLVLDCHHIGNTFLVFRQRIQSLFDKREMFIGDFGVIIGLPAVGSRSTALGVLYSPCNLAVASPAASAFRVSDCAKKSSIESPLL